MKILLSGDSNMAGTELKDTASGLGARLSSMLGATKVINTGLAGASNDYIYQTTLDCIKETPDFDFVVVGWSEVSRLQWFMDDRSKSGYFWEISNFDPNSRPVPDEYQLRHRHWQQKMQRNAQYHEALSKYWHEKVYNLHRLMQHRKIPHLFFNAFHPFRIHHPEYHFEWDNCFYEPYAWDKTYIQWCQDREYEEITPGLHHFKEDGQLAWATELFNHIKKHQLL